MPIRDVPLNVDRFGQAGGLVSRFGPLPSIGGGGGYSTSGLYDFLRQRLQQKARLEDEFARAELKALKQQIGQQGKAFSRQMKRADRTGPNRAEREAATLAARARAAQVSGLEAAANRARAENAARGEAIRMAGTPAAPGPLGFNRYSLANALRQFSGGQTGRADFQGLPVQAHGAGAQPSFAGDVMRARQLAAMAPAENIGSSGMELPTYFIRQGLPQGEVSEAQFYGGLPTGLQRNFSRAAGSTLPYGGIRVPRPNTFTNLPQREKGTLPGTLKRNEIAKLHKGEVVISADQVDEPLMAYLMEDKLNKLSTGQMNGKGTGPGKSYQRGSVLEYPEGPISRAQMLGLMRGDIIPAPPTDVPPVYSGPISSGPPAQSYSPEWLAQFGKDYLDAFRSQVEEQIPSFGEAGVFGVLGGEAKRGLDIAKRYLFGGGEAAPAAGGAPGTTEPGQAGRDAGRDLAIPPPSLSERMITAAEEAGAPETSFDVTSKEFRESESAKAQARRLRGKADQMQAYLLKAVDQGNVSPEMFKAMTDQINRYDKVADMAEKRLERVETTATAEKQAGKERVQQAYSTAIQAQATQDARQMQELARQHRDLDNDMDKLFSTFRGAEGDEQESIIQRYAEKFRQQRAIGGDMISEEQALINARYELGAISREEAIEELAALEGI